MSLYHMMHGVQAVTFIILPMLDKHPDEYPRFRDCFLADEEHPEYGGKIHVYTRTGGNNRKNYEDDEDVDSNAMWEGNEMMKAMPGYIADFDDNSDSTYASWIFEVPEKWRADFDLINAGKLDDVSEAYKAQIKKIYPKLADKFDEIFKGAVEPQPPA